MATVDYFLKIDGVDGESKDDQFPKWIQLRSWGWGESNSSTIGSTGSGGGTGKVSMHDLSVAAFINASSNTISQYCAAGKKIAWVELDCRKAGETPQIFLKIKLTDVLVSSYHIAGGMSGDDAHPVDQFTLNFAKVESSYGSQDEKGKVNSLDKKMNWDLRNMKAS